MLPIILVAGERLLSRFAVPSLLILGAVQCGALFAGRFSPWLLAGFALPVFESYIHTHLLKRWPDKLVLATVVLAFLAMRSRLPLHSNNPHRAGLSISLI